MTQQTMIDAVIGQGNAAAGTFVGEAALPAAYELSRPAAVDKQDALLTALKVLLQLLPEIRADRTSVAVSQLPLHIYDLNLR